MLTGCHYGIPFFFVSCKLHERLCLLTNQVLIHLKSIIRDRLLTGVIFIACILILLVPVFSNFSMRQVQELSITLSLSATSSILLVLSLLLGGTSIWRDIERRYTPSVLTLPVSRALYVWAKFIAIAIFLLFSGFILALASAIVIWTSSLSYPSDIPIHWLNIALAIGGDVMKYILLTASAVLFSTFSTSFFLPFFGTTALYFVGSASQEVFEFVSGPYGKELSPLVLLLIKSVYFVMPNFSGFNHKVHAIYGLPLDLTSIAYSSVYGILYTMILVTLAIVVFSRRELP